MGKYYRAQPRGFASGLNFATKTLKALGSNVDALNLGGGWYGWQKSSRNLSSAQSRSIQLSARKDHSTFHLLGEGSDRTFVDGQTAARLRRPGLKLITALPCLPSRLAHGTPPYLAYCVSPLGQTKSSWRKELSHV